MMSAFPSFSLDFIMGLEWDAFYYWHRRAIEIHGAMCQRGIKFIPETEDTESAKVDDDTFEKQRKILYARIEAHEKSMEGTISG